jgi:hypothetical protein
MSGNATPTSLSLLAGGKSAVGDELAKETGTATKTEAAEETSTETSTETSDEPIDLDVMTSAQIDALVKKENIKPPVGWSKFAVQEKRDWLYQNVDASQKVDVEDEAGNGVELTKAIDETLTETNIAPVAEAKPVEVKAPKVKAKLTPIPISGAVLAEAAVAAAEAATQTEPVTESKSTAVVTKPKGKAAKAAMGSEIMPPDELSNVVHEIENLQEKQACELVGELAEQAEVTYFRLGGVLSRVQQNAWFKPYSSFREFVEHKHNINYRKATYWVGIYNELAESKVPWEKVKGVGWTKLKEIASVLTPENVEEWVKIAMENTTLNLMQIVANSKKSGEPKTIEDKEVKIVTTMTFKVHEDQKAGIEMAIAKAKTEANTQVATVALEAICMDYMSAKTLVQKLKEMGAEAGLKMVEQAYPDLTIEVTLNEATEKAA